MAGAMMQTSIFKTELENRGIKLNPPASIKDIKRLEEAIGGRLSRSMLMMYSEFDGFRDCFDKASFISVWPISKIISNIKNDRLPYVPFADRAFDAEIFEMYSTDEDEPIFENGNKIFNSYIEFWEMLLTDRLAI